MKEDVRRGATFQPWKKSSRSALLSQAVKRQSKTFPVAPNCWLLLLLLLFWFFWALQIHICSRSSALIEFLNSSTWRHIFQQHMLTRVQLSWSSRLPVAFLSDHRKCAQAARIDHQVCFPGNLSSDTGSGGRTVGEQLITGTAWTSDLDLII